MKKEGSSQISDTPHGILCFGSSYFLSPLVANEAHNTLL